MTTETKKTIYDLFGERYAQEVETYLLVTLGGKRAPKLTEVRAACEAAAKSVLNRFARRAPDVGGVGLPLFFSFGDLGCISDAEEVESDEVLP